MSQQTDPHPRIPRFTAADRFRKARELAEMSQLELAERIGVSKNTISNYETGATTHLRRIVIGQWAWATGVPAEWLTTGVEPADGPTGPSGTPDLGERQSGWTSRVAQRHLALAG